MKFKENKFKENKLSQIKIDNRKLIWNKGVNDAPYKVSYTKDKITTVCPYYRVWYQMFNRCYSGKKTYRNVTICKKWWKFSIFKKWMETQDWKNKDLDKDIIAENNLEYNEFNCCFVNPYVNYLFSTSKSKLPKGVSYKKDTKRFVVHCSDNKGSSKNIGTYDTIKQASDVYISYKRNIVDEICSEICESRIILGLQNKMNMLEKDNNAKVLKFSTFATESPEADADAAGTDGF